MQELLNIWVIVASCHSMVLCYNLHLVFLRTRGTWHLNYVSMRNVTDAADCLQAGVCEEAQVRQE